MRAVVPDEGAADAADLTEHLRSSNLVELVGDDTDRDADLLATLTPGGTWTVADGSGRLAVRRRPAREAGALAADLEQTARYRRLLALDNPRSPLAGNLELRLLRASDGIAIAEDAALTERHPDRDRDPPSR